jgi:hypothetical protein
MELDRIVREFAVVMEAVDRRRPQAASHRDATWFYQPGIGPFAEDAAVAMTVAQMQAADPDVYADAEAALPRERPCVRPVERALGSRHRTHRRFVMFKRETHEEKAAKAAAKDAEKVAKAEAKARAEWLASPVGRATTARDTGAHFFQIDLDLTAMERSAWAAADARSGYNVTERRQGSHADTLGQIEAVGWRLEHAGYVFIQTGQVSRDKLMSSGQEVGVQGRVVGVYLFRRVDKINGVVAGSDAG